MGIDSNTCADNRAWSQVHGLGYLDCDLGVGHMENRTCGQAHGLAHLDSRHGLGNVTYIRT
jgi:hypothetical protein